MANYVLVDFRPSQYYKMGHIPNAINLWRSDIEDTTYTYKGMMPTKTQLEKLLSKKGVKISDTLIIYDDNASINAARLWWVLDHYGFNQTKILNGGIISYLDKKQTLSTSVPEIEESSFIFKAPDPKRHIQLVELEKLIENESALSLLDCRTEHEYSGLRHKKGAKKAGKIPTSVYLGWSNTVSQGKSHKFLAIDQLKEIYENTITDKDQEIVVYCHSGVRSSHATFVLTQLLGYKNVRNYEGSWTEWSHHDVPFEQDVETEIFE